MFIYSIFYHRNANNLENNCFIEKASKLEELKVILYESTYLDILQYIPKTIKIIDLVNGTFERTAQNRQQLKDLIQRMENKFTVFQMYYPLDEKNA